MGTILSRLVERLDNEISRRKKARQKLRDKNLEDAKLEHQIQRLVSIRNRLHKRDATEAEEIDCT